MTRPLGYSLVELLFVLLIAGILLSLATPALVSTVQDNRETQAVNQLLGALHYARGTAVMERKVVGICAGDAGCDVNSHWEKQVLIFFDHNRNGRLDEGEVTLRSIQLPEGQTWSWKGFRRTHFVQFQPTGSTIATNGTFTLCDKGIAKREIVINLTGRARSRAPSSNAQCD